MSTLAKRVKAKLCRPSYIYCNICGYIPPDERSECNWTPLKFWDPDDGWKIGTLCRVCAEEYLDEKPCPGDYAYDKQNTIEGPFFCVLDFIDDSGTDEDPIPALY